MISCKINGILSMAIIFTSACQVDFDNDVEDDEPEYGDQEDPDVSIAEEGIISSVDDTTEIENDSKQDNDNDWLLGEAEITESIRNFSHGGGRLRIYAEFAPYYNSFSGGEPKERIARLPAFTQNSWTAVSILDGTYRVWSTQNGSGWWNGPDHHKWVYDDTNLSHNQINERHQLKGTIRPIDHPEFNLGSGIIFMAFNEDKRNFRGVNNLKDMAPELRSLNVQYAYEVFAGTDYKKPFRRWFHIYNATRSQNVLPVFDITAWSTDPDCDKSVKLGHVHRKTTRKQIQFSTLYRAHHPLHGTSGFLYIGFYTSCHLNDGDLQPLANWLSTTQARI